MSDKGRQAVKRKRGRLEHEGDDDLSRRVAGKLHHCLKDTRKAARKAKTFEIQKLVKKLKSLREKDKQSTEIRGLEDELDILKTADHEPFANTALKSKLNKDKILSQDPRMSAAVAEQLASNVVQPAPPGSHLAKVNGRMLSSKVLAAEVSRVVEELKGVLHPEMKAPHEDSSDDESDRDEEPASRMKKFKLSQDAGDNTADEGNEGEGSGSESHQVILSADEESGDDAGWESGSVAGDQQVTKLSNDGSGPEDSDSEDGDDEEHEDSDSQPQIPSIKSGTSKKAAVTSTKEHRAGESTFLPSLSVGFTRGDSDSEWSDREADAADGVRKNRRGQRARRAIWEKKYGRNANHVKKQQEIPAQGSGSRGKTVSVRKNEHGRETKVGLRPSPPRRAAETPRQVPQGSVQPYGKDKRKEEKPLHPSWEAKRKQKEKEGAGILPPQGKKIMF